MKTVVSLSAPKYPPEVTKQMAVAGLETKLANAKKELGAILKKKHDAFGAPKDVKRAQHKKVFDLVDAHIKKSTSTDRLSVSSDQLQEKLVLGARITSVSIKPLSENPKYAGTKLVDHGRVTDVEQSEDGSIKSATITFKRGGEKKFSLKELETHFSAPMPLHSSKGTAFRFLPTSKTVVEKADAHAKDLMGILQAYKKASEPLAVAFNGVMKTRKLLLSKYPNSERHVNAHARLTLSKLLKQLDKVVKLEK